MQGLRQLADVLNVETARLSGDPQRLQLALGESQSRKLQEVNNLIDAEIDKLDIPESQKRLLKALSPQQKYQAIYGEEKKKTISDVKSDLVSKVRKGEKLSKTDLDTLTVIDPALGELIYRYPDLFEIDEEDENSENEIPTINTQEEYDNLPKGATYITNGTTYVKGK